MSVDPIRRRYGYGAAHLCLSPEPHRRREPPPRAAVFEAVQDAGGALLLGLLVFAVVQSLLERDRTDRDAVTIVPFETAERTPEPIPEPEPVPVIPPKPAPEPAPAPVVEVAMAPLPSAPPEPPAPPPSRRPPVRSEPASRPPPRAEIEPIAAVREAKPDPVRPERTLPPSAPKAAASPSVKIDAAVSAPIPEPTTAPSRFRTAKVETRRRPVAPAVAVRIDSIQPGSAPAAPAPTAPRRADPAPPARAARKPRLDLPAASAPGLERAPRTDGSSRSATPAPRPALRAAAKTAAAVDVPVLRSDAPRAARKGSVRAATHAPASPPESRAPRVPERSLRGVPLGSLAACVSDRREDALKKAVIATVRNREECVSAAGRYRLIETKNLNAFLMWVERAPHRGEADRCAELELALQCLRRSE